MILLLRISFSMSWLTSSAMSISPSRSAFAGCHGLELQRMDPRHQRRERAVHHLMALDERLAGEAVADDRHREVVSGASGVVGGDCPVREDVLQTTANLLRIQHPPVIAAPEAVARRNPLGHGGRRG